MRKSNPAEVYPVFREKSVPIFLCSDANYVRPALVTAASIKAHAAPDNNYDICILHTDKIEPKVKTAADELMDERFSIRFIDISENVSRVAKKLLFSRHVSGAAYWRLFIPEVCRDYEKVFYMDTDMIALDDPGKLYNNTDVEGYFLGAARDYFLQAALGLALPNLMAEREYIDKRLKIPLDDYFQAGLLLLNVRRLREADCSALFFKILDELGEPLYWDQDVLNRACHGRVLFIDPAWNMRHNIPLLGGLNPTSAMPPEKLEIFEKAFERPKILHYPGPKKPWKNLDVPKAGLWWQYAAQTSLLIDFIREAAAAARPGPLSTPRPFRKKWLHKWWYRLSHALAPTLTDAMLIAFSGAFDSSYYFNSYPALLKNFRNPILGYAWKGAWEGRNPAAWFDTKKYLLDHPELRKKNINPFVHFLYS